MRMVVRVKTWGELGQTLWSLRTVLGHTWKFLANDFECLWQRARSMSLFFAVVFFFFSFYHHPGQGCLKFEDGGAQDWSLDETKHQRMSRQTKRAREKEREGLRHALHSLSHTKEQSRFAWQKKKMITSRWARDSFLHFELRKPGGIILTHTLFT